MANSWTPKGQRWVMSSFEASCGAYAFLWSCALLRAPKHKFWANQYKRFRSLYHKTKNSGIVPNALIPEFKDMNLQVHMPPHQNKLQKIKWIKQQINKQNPLVMCIQRPFYCPFGNDYRLLDWHLVVVCGYDGEALYVIDPAFTPDSDVMPMFPIRRIEIKKLIGTVSVKKIYVRDPSHCKAQSAPSKKNGTKRWLIEKARVSVWVNNSWVISISK